MLRTAPVHGNLRLRLCKTLRQEVRQKSREGARHRFGGGRRSAAAEEKERNGWEIFTKGLHTSGKSSFDREGALPHHTLYIADTEDANLRSQPSGPAAAHLPRSAPLLLPPPDLRLKCLRMSRTRTGITPTVRSEPALHSLETLSSTCSMPRPYPTIPSSIHMYGELVC